MTDVRAEELREEGREPWLTVMGHSALGWLPFGTVAVVGHAYRALWTNQFLQVRILVDTNTVLVRPPRVGMRLVALTRAHPVVAYFVGVFTISWSYWLVVLGVLGHDGLAWFAPGAFGPAIAALLVTAVADGRRGIRTFLRRLTQWRVGWRWYALVLLGLPALGLLVGVPFSDGSQRFSGSASQIAMIYITSYVFLAVLGGGQEELGWRGFALPRMQDRMGPVRASVVLGLLWGMWHLPVFVFVPNYNSAGSDPLDVALMFIVFTAAGAVGLSLLLTWLFNHTQGSILIAVLAHASLNAVFGFVGATSTTYILMYLLFAAVGWALTAASNRRLGAA